MIGDSSVGKTRLIRNVVDLEFQEDLLATIGIDKIETKITLKNGENIKLILWDIAGKERFLSIDLKPDKNSDGVIINFALNNKIFFENVIYWLRL